MLLFYDFETTGLPVYGSRSDAPEQPDTVRGYSVLPPSVPAVMTCRAMPTDRVGVHLQPQNARPTSGRFADSAPRNLYASQPKHEPIQRKTMYVNPIHDIRKGFCPSCYLRMTANDMGQICSHCGFFCNTRAEHSAAR